MQFFRRISIQIISEKLRKDFDFLKTYDRAEQVSTYIDICRVNGTGKADRAGNLISSSVGDSKSFYITYSYTTQKKSFRCYAAGIIVMFTVIRKVLINIRMLQSYATQVADYFDNTIYSLVHNL
jgi:hypothetical protein